MLCVDNQAITCLSPASSSFAVDKVTRKECQSVHREYNTWKLFLILPPFINSSTDTLLTKKVNSMRNQNYYLFKCVKWRFGEQSENKVIFYALTDRLHIFWSALLSPFFLFLFSCFGYFFFCAFSFCIDHFQL